MASRLLPSLTARMLARCWLTIPRVSRTHPALPDGGETFTATFEGHRVRGTRWGRGPVVYLVHGWAGDSRQWAPLVSPLVAAGYRVVTFDAPSHGCSDPGPSGPQSSHGVEFGKALDAVAALHGPAHAVVAHSMGALATMLTLRFGWLSTEVLVFVAPLCDLRHHLDEFALGLHLGRRARRQFTRAIETRTGVPIAEVDLLVLSPHADGAPLLVVHDQSDPRTPVAASAALADRWPGGALLHTTRGLGHRRPLAAPAVHERIVSFMADPATREEAPDRLNRGSAVSPPRAFVNEDLTS